MPIETKLVEYKDGDYVLEGLLSYDTDKPGPLPLVVVFHAWAGRDDFAVGRAKELAKLGYAGFAADVYGKGVIGSGPEENQKLIKPFFVDRSGLLIRRLKLSMHTAKALDIVDKTKIGAIGYCFGGLCVLDLARVCVCGTLKAVVSFHGQLSTPPSPGTEDIKAKVLVLNGHSDPMVKPEQMTAFGQEMTDRHADWQIHDYGNTFHGFTMPGTNMPSMGMCYSALADKRSWQAMKNHFDETFCQ